MTDAKPYVVDPSYYWRPLATAPLGKKLQLLTEGGVAVHGVLTARDIREQWYRGWTPLPKVPEWMR
jgi:hypothetical protein